ncbi:MAG: M48 family metallopeptidase [Gemmatimonas sp.]|jgi:predicted Zn-dependent protease|uniref:M48 family metallopeptidase n=1 Tax=Gemmatimonas sp. TaxID=1962908 RepID=UPI0022C7DD58|nr:M48 family metallopeptidase [Gemmatimonas sp.]MCE2954730.1 M48 family metallopeptidase [Gemmatimonas sp.]MCZ8267431.1 M48 family metallopeptidase [Gemmatimonas sp.]
MAGNGAWGSGADTGRVTTRVRRAAAVGALLAVGACVPGTAQEVAMGSQYAQQIEQQLPMVRDPEIVRYINVLGDSIARVVDDRSLTWRFNVVDQPEINAFAVPGGHIYVNRGLIERTTNMSELAGVLGHEIAHVTQRHSMKQMAAAQRANYGLSIGCILAPSFCQGLAGTGVSVLAQAGFAKFSRDDETESDRFGVKYVTRAGIDPRGMPSMFRILLRERERNPGSVEAWFASHPIEESRIRTTEEEIDRIDPVVLRSLTRDSRSFQSFKERLAALPRSPAPRR